MRLVLVIGIAIIGAAIRPEWAASATTPPTVMDCFTLALIVAVGLDVLDFINALKQFLYSKN